MDTSQQLLQILVAMILQYNLKMALFVGTADGINLEKEKSHIKGIEFGQS